MFSTANTALISLIGASRIIYGMGEAKALPEVTAKILPKKKTPWFASLVVLAAAVALIPLGKLETVAAVSSMATMVAFFMVNVALITLRYTQSDTKRPFKVPFSIGKVPVIAVLAGLISLTLLTQFEAKVYLIGFGLLGVAAIGFIWNDKKS